MPLLSFNEIRSRAHEFSREWADATSEQGEAQTFWNELFQVYGLRRRQVALFEKHVDQLGKGKGRIDLFWPGKVIAEHKSRGESLDKAQTQAFGYAAALAAKGNGKEAPRYILVCDFETLVIHDLEPQGEAPEISIPIAKLHEHVEKLGFLAGYKPKRLDPEDPANEKAATLLATLKDSLDDGGYPREHLEAYMVRLLFCLFAEDTQLFDAESVTDFITSATEEDGSDVGPQLARLFQVLDTPTGNRQRHLDERLATLDYVNGDLFHDQLPIADFDRPMRDALLDCCSFRWNEISPAVFGSLFQSIMTDKERRKIGAHYTTERDIVKLVDSLFLDRLREELGKIGNDKKKLAAFHDRLGEIEILDPACGCGNFLVIAYRELRRIEMQVLLRLFPRDAQHAQSLLFSTNDLKVHIDQVHGIEIEPWPARIAQVAMYMIDHIMNVELSATFGQNFAQLPLGRYANIHCANALRTDWAEVLPPERCAFVLGNPPFIGAKYMERPQRDDVDLVWGDTKGAGLLDYVTCWYAKALAYTRGTTARCAFVSTNSITQGEQAGTLWNELFRRGAEIDFGHRTFPWVSEARGKAHVHVVIVGFGHGEGPKGKRIYEYGPKGEPLGVSTPKSISPYLTEGPPKAITNRSKPLCDVPSMSYGSMQNDGGFLVLSEDERVELLAECPAAEPFLRRFMGSSDMLNGTVRWCLWLVDAQPEKIRAMTPVLNRVELVRKNRLESSRATTRALAKTPALFGEIRQPKTRYLGFPRTSSERREYIPLGYFGQDVIANTDLPFVPDATPYHFGVLHSAMHMAWVRAVCGRLKSDYRYSAKLVYNNFPWPDADRATDARIEKVSQAAQSVLDARAKHPRSTLADLYDPLTMPQDLARAHAKLDRAVDLCYRKDPFESERKRFEFLFERWEGLVAPVMARKKAGRKPS